MTSMGALSKLNHSSICFDASFDSLIGVVVEGSSSGVVLKGDVDSLISASSSSSPSPSFVGSSLENDSSCVFFLFYGLGFLSFSCCNL